MRRVPRNVPIGRSRPRGRTMAPRGLDMANASRGSYAKRQKEMARIEKQKQKAAKRQENKDRKATGTAAADGEDPDIAGIVPGPQAPAFEDEERP